MISVDYLFSGTYRGVHVVGTSPCVVCGRPIVEGREAGRLYVHAGGTAVVTEEEYDIMETVESGAGLGGWPIGRDCLRKHPELRPYLSP